MEIKWPVDSDGEIWLEYGFTTDNMLWYNEGNAEEFTFWYRALMKKLRTDEPKGEMYFIMGVYGELSEKRKDVRIILGETR